MRYPHFVSDLWRHRALLWQFTLRNIEVRHKGSHLGLIWSILNPLLLLGLYVFVFGHIFGGSFGVRANETPIDYALGLFIGLAVFQLIAEVIGVSPSIILTQPNFVKKVVFPLEILPVAGVGASIFHFLVSIALVALGIACVGPGLSWSVLWLPVIMIPFILFIIGLAWAIAALGVFFRDISQAAQFLSQVIMFASAIFYPASRIAAKAPTAWLYLRVNPVLVTVEEVRNVVLWNLPLNLHHLAFLYGCGLVGLWGGHAVFARLKPAFADVL